MTDEFYYTTPETDLSMLVPVALQQVDNAIVRGRVLLKSVNAPDYDHRTSVEQENLLIKFNQWDSYCFAVIKSLSSTSKYINAYSSVRHSDNDVTVAVDDTRLVAMIDDRLRVLDVIRENVAFQSELANIQSASSSAQQRSALTSRKVFIVHGHETSAKYEIARWLERIGLEAVILHEQADQGRIILEKLEDHAAEAAYVVVVLTPDDEGNAVGAIERNARARQNVIFEMGLFFGLLGRKRVTALCTKGVELPSDVHGLVYAELDKTGGWKLRLALELEAAGLSIDRSKM